MAHTGFSALDRLLEGLQRLLQRYPDEKTRLLREIGTKMLNEVEEQLAQANFSDGGTKLASWQGYHIGSRGGYAAVRPMNRRAGANSPAAITTYNELGHRVRRPSGRDPHYRPRNHVAAVRGYHFYARAKPLVAQLAAEELSRLAELLSSELEDAL